MSASAARKVENLEIFFLILRKKLTFSEGKLSVINKAFVFQRELD